MNLLYNEILPITGTIQWWGAILCFDFLPVLKGEADVVDAVDGFSRFIYVLLNVGGETGASNLGRQQNIKSVRPELLRNQMFRPFCILRGCRIEELRNQTGVQESAGRWFTRR